MNKCNCEGHRGDSHFCPLHGEVTHPDHAVKAEQSPQTEQAEASSLSALLCVELAEIKGKYYELILAVATKNPDETRHETALRYITQAENTTDQCAAKENT